MITPQKGLLVPKYEIGDRVEFTDDGVDRNALMAGKITKIKYIQSGQKTILNQHYYLIEYGDVITMIAEDKIEHDFPPPRVV